MSGKNNNKQKFIEEIQEKAFRELNLLIISDLFRFKVNTILFETTVVKFRLQKGCEQYQR